MAKWLEWTYNIDLFLGSQTDPSFQNKIDWMIISNLVISLVP